MRFRIYGRLEESPLFKNSLNDIDLTGNWKDLISKESRKKIIRNCTMIKGDVHIT